MRLHPGRSLLVLSLLSSPSTANADGIDLKFSGSISSDMRYRLGGEAVDSTYPSQYKLLDNGFSRNENRIRTRLSLGIADKVRAVAETELVYYGYSDVHDIDSATLRERVDPFWLEAYAAYVDIYKVLPGLDLRIGRQIVHWGAADQFNPTSNVNTLDLSDPLLFGRALANNMVRADWNPKGDIILTAVWVPIFRPAQLPRSAPVALLDSTRPAPVQEAAVIDALGPFASLAKGVDVTALQPDPSLANSQLALRLGGRLFDQDVAISYYHGRFGIPVPAWSILHDNRRAEVGVVWPREDVVGLDAAGSIGWLGGAGWWAEGTVTFPEEVQYNLYSDLGGTRTPITFAYGDDGIARVQMNSAGAHPIIIPTDPFVKLTLGADYSFGDRLYLNLQYVHGFIDEFGAGVIARPGAHAGDPARLEQRLGDYVVAGADLKFKGGTVVARFFGVLKLPSLIEGDSFSDWSAHPTGVLFPELIWAPWDATQLIAGAFVFLGDRSTKFGDPAAGASEVFVKAQLTF